MIMASGIKLAPLMTEIKVDIKNFRSDMDKAAAIGKSEAERISKELENVSNVGGKLSKIGDALTLGLTTPLLAAGAAVGKMAIDTENSLGILQGQLGTTSEETERLREIAQNVYEGGYGDSIDDCISDLVLLRQNVKESADWTDEMTQSTLEQIKTITALFDTNADEVTRTVQVMQSSGLIENISEGLDLITYGFQNGANYSGEMLDTLREYSPQFVKLGLDGNEAMQYLIQGAENGAFNLDKVGDALKELSIRVVDGSDTTKQGFEAMGLSADEMAQKFAAGGETAQQAFQETLNGLASIEDPVQRNIAGVNLFGTMWEDLGETVILSLAGVQGELEGVEGATERAGERMNEAFSTRAIGLARQFMDSLLPVGEALLDIGEDILPDVKETAEDFADAMENMDSATAGNIVKFGALMAASGPVIKTISGGISVYTKLSSVMGGASKALGAFGTAQKTAAAAAAGTNVVVGTSGLTGSMVGLLGTCAPLAAGLAAVGAGVYALHEQNDVLNSTVLKSREEMSWLEETLADLQGVTRYTKEELEELGFVHKEFSDDLSPEFREAVEESTRKVQDFSVFLREIGFDDVITQDETDEFVRRVNDTCDEVISTIEGRKEEAQNGLRELFIADDQVIDDSEQRVLEIIAQSSDNQITEVQALQSEILAIQQTAVDEKRQLNEQEIADIESKNARIRQIELEAVGGTQEEILYAKNEFAARAKNLDLESASELLQEKAKLRDEEVVQIQAQYDTEIELLKASLDGKTAEEQAAINEQIANLEKDRDDKIKIQQELYDEYLGIIEENNPKLLEAINELNGKILTGEDEKNADYLQKARDRFIGLEQITKSGCYTVYDTQRNTNTDVVVNYDEATGKIIGIYSESAGLIAGYTNEIQSDTMDMALNSEGAFELIGTSLEGLQVKNGQLVNSNGEVVNSLDGVKASADGTREGIVLLNGTPCQIKVNKDGTIADLQAISNAADSAAATRTLTINAVIGSVTGGVGIGADILNQAMSYNYNGLDNVPYDGYQAVLHKGERVLTAEENKAYSSDQGIDYAKMEQCMKSAVRELTMSIAGREFGRMIDNRLRERGLL